MTTDQTAAPVMPFLRYRDPVAAVDWLVATFGFEKGLIVPSAERGIEHAQLWIGTSVVMLGGEPAESGLGMKLPSQAGGVTQGIYVAVTDTDAHHARAKAAGAEIVYEPQDQLYGSREYAARDPEGNLWSFGTYRPTRP